MPHPLPAFAYSARERLSGYHRPPSSIPYDDALDPPMRDTNLSDLALLRDAAEEAGALAMRYFRRAPHAWSKHGGSPVTEADMAVDAFRQDMLLAARPDYGWLSEETADDPVRRSQRRTCPTGPVAREP